ncbi:uncharacterized protein DNG_09258 [Cephalotrichum gorgonifer]|uniref:Glycoside hydrolase 131 catalytic N-terminal domain-containing protein n=1 Tax=Cephalotrichum gorgonifer TaxID=2041049 RepID=A0AAE8SZ91_9PEZI|nr:uncharacterized protein DNG_09258 [Cephalotrichum gorgonifer]
MRANTFAALSILSLATGSLARLGSRPTTSSDDDLISQKSRVTAFVKTGDGLKVECWEIGTLIPQQVTMADGSKGQVARMSMQAGIREVSILSWPSDVVIFSFLHGSDELQGNSFTFNAQPNLFTLKDGLIMIDAVVADADAGVAAESSGTYVFADLNGDDWFYFEDSTTADSKTASSQRQQDQSHFRIRTVSGSDTTLINFEYEHTPSHKVLHEGRCNFAGLKPVVESSQYDPDAGLGLRVQPSEL